MEALKCPSCGSPDIIKGAELEYQCINCGTKSKLSNDQSYLDISTITCPDCGFTNKSDARFCGDCGKKLIKYCINCGMETLLDTKFCTNCGKDAFSSDGYKSVILKPGERGQYNKFEVIKCLRNDFGLGLVEAKSISENTTVIASLIRNPEAIELKNRYEQHGAIIEIKDINLPVDPYLKKKSIN